MQGYIAIYTPYVFVLLPLTILGVIAISKHFNCKSPYQLLVAALVFTIFGTILSLTPGVIDGLVCCLHNGVDLRTHHVPALSYARGASGNTRHSDLTLRIRSFYVHHLLKCLYGAEKAIRWQISNKSEHITHSMT